MESGAIPTAWYRVGIWKPQPYPSLNEVKGEDGEAGSRAPHVSKATCDQIPGEWSDTKGAGIASGFESPAEQRAYLGDY